MTNRVRPVDCEVLPDDPFQNDLLDRKPSIETLTTLIGSLEGPCAMALDSEWGGGKTTFLRMWAAHLRQEGFAVAEFNAWETDFSGDPFVALSSKLKEQFDTARPDSRSESAQRFADASKRIARRALPLAVRILSQGLLDSGSIEQVIADELSTLANDRLQEFEEVEQSFSDFKQSLAEEALRLSAFYDDRPLFVMIDELDRCRPSYAIELLEVAKHLFSVDRIVFVLALNRLELAHSIKAIYGTNFDAKGYLHRFFDLDYSLPWPDREKFVLQALRDSNLDALFHAASGPFEVVPTLVARLLAWSHLDLRRIGQASRRMALACASLGDAFPGVTASLCLVLVLRALDPDLYRQFRDEEISDAETIEQLYGCGSLRDLQSKAEGHVFEAAISVVWFELLEKSKENPDVFVGSPHLNNCASTKQRLERKARDFRVGERRNNISDNEGAELNRAFGTINAARSLLNHSDTSDYASAIRHIELLPSDEA